MSVVSLAETKAHLNVSTGTDDAEVQSFLDRAEAAITSQIGPIGSVAKTERVRGLDTVLWLSWPPVISLTSVTSVEGTTVPVSSLTVMSGGRVEYTQWGFFASRFYDVVYQAGRAALPDDLRLAVLEMTRHLWATQRPGDGGRFSSAAQLQTSNTLPGAASTFPFRVEQLLAPHRSPNLI